MDSLLTSFFRAGFHNNNFNDRQGGFHERDSGANQRGRGGRNWRDEDNGDRRNFSRGGGNFERKGSRWMGNQRDDDWDNEDQRPQSESNDQPQDTSARHDETFDNGGADNGGGEDFPQSEKHEDAPPGTDEQQQSFDDRPEETSHRPEPTFDDHQESQADNGGNEPAGNTTPLCDEAESKE